MRNFKSEMAVIWDGPAPNPFVLLAALQQIADASIPDQPASDEGDALSWAQRHVAKLRRIAKEAVGDPSRASEQRTVA